MTDQASQRNFASSVSRQYCLCDKGLDPRKHAEPFVIMTRGNALDTSATRVSPTVKKIHFKLGILPRTRKSVSLNGAAVITKDSSDLHPQRASMLGTGPGASSRNCLSPRTIASDARSARRQDSRMRLMMLTLPKVLRFVQRCRNTVAAGKSKCLIRPRISRRYFSRRLRICDKSGSGTETKTNFPNASVQINGHNLAPYVRQYGRTEYCFGCLSRADGEHDYCSGCQ
jgi:hypothetical protein